MRFSVLFATLIVLFTNCATVSAAPLFGLPSLGDILRGILSPLVPQKGRSKPLLIPFKGQSPLPSLQDIINQFGRPTTPPTSPTSPSKPPSSPPSPATPASPFSDLQCDIVVGMQKPKETFFFFKINDVRQFKSLFGATVLPLITATSTLLGPVASQPQAFLNIAFSASGMTALGVDANSLGDSEFAKGQFADASNLGDKPDDWEAAFKGTGIHGVMLIGSDADDKIDTLLGQVTSKLGNCISEVTRVEGSARPGQFAGHEHFGYLDGISNPALSGLTTNVHPGQAVINQGVIITGLKGDKSKRPSWVTNGSFLVFRKLQQFVPEWDSYLNAQAVNGTSADLIGARVIGRWKSGAPVDLAPLADDPALGADPNRNNNFDYAHSGKNINSDQTSCPFSAHTRKTNPRGDFGNSLQNNMAIRAGIPYGDEVTDGEKNSQTTQVNRGLAFVEYQSSIADGFKTQQVTWANDVTFPFGKNQNPGFDPIIGTPGNDAKRIVLGLNPKDASKQYTMPQFVRPLGGEYFFSPSLSALKNTLLV